MSNIFEKAVEHTKETWKDVLSGDATTAQYVEAGAEVVAVAALARLGLSRCAMAFKNTNAIGTATSCADNVAGVAANSADDLLRNAIQSGDDALVAALRDGEESLKIFAKKAKIIDAQPNGYGGYFLHCDDGGLILSGPYKSSYDLKDLSKVARDYAQRLPTPQVPEQLIKKGNPISEQTRKLCQDELLKPGTPISQAVRDAMQIPEV